MAERSVRRLLLMGCPRSGTTLVQAMLAAHPQMWSFPESNYAAVVVGDYERRVLGWTRPTPSTRLRLALGLATRSARSKLERVMGDIGRPDLARFPGRGPVTIGRALALCAERIDRAAIDAGFERWMDKSPTAYAYLDHIERSAPHDRYVHVVRPGTDVVASLIDASRRYPGSFWARHFSDPDTCVECWNRAVSAAVASAAKENHAMLRFDELLARPEDTLKRLSRFLDLPFDPAMLEGYDVAAGGLRRGGEKWKEGTSRGLGSEHKFARLFDAGEQQRIRAVLQPLPSTAD